MKSLGLLLMVLIFFSCSENKNYEIKTIDGVEVVSNKKTPLKPSFKVVITDSVVINSVYYDGRDSVHFYVSNLDLDEFGNVYIIDDTKSKIFKFDSTGTYKLNFGGRGNGPGEFLMYSNFTVSNNMINVFCAEQLIQNTYSYDGVFQKTIKYDSYDSFPNNCWIVGNLFASNVIIPNSKKEQYKRELWLLDKNYKRINKYYSDTYDLSKGVRSFDSPDFLSIAVDKENKVFVPEFSTTMYKINVYDLQGKKRGIIKKDYTAIPYSKREIAKLQKDYASSGLKVDAKNKMSIRDLWIDKYNNLWIRPASIDDKNNIFDLFDNRGVFINRITLSGVDENVFMFFAYDKLVIYSTLNNYVKICSYRFEE